MVNSRKWGWVGRECGNSMGRRNPVLVRIAQHRAHVWRQDTLFQWLDYIILMIILFPFQTQNQRKNDDQHCFKEDSEKPWIRRKESKFNKNCYMKSRNAASRKVSPPWIDARNTSDFEIRKGEYSCSHTVFYPNIPFGMEKGREIDATNQHILHGGIDRAYGSRSVNHE